MDKSTIRIKDFNELIERLENIEKEVTRWPVIFISVRNLTSWNKLTSWLQVRTEFIRLSHFCSDPDRVPWISIEDIKEDLLHSNSSLTLLPMGEWLQLGLGDPEDLIKELAVLALPSTRKIFIPLFQSEELLLRSLKSISRWITGDCASLFKLEESSTPIKITIAPNLPVLDLPHRERVQGIRNYFRLWEKPSHKPKQHIVLLTAFAPVLKDIENTKIEVLRNAFEVLKWHFSDTIYLKQEWGSKNQWEWLLENLKQGDTFESLCQRLLNIYEYSLWCTLEDWPKLTETERWLFWLWSKIAKGDDPILNLIRESKDMNEFIDILTFSPLNHKENLEKKFLQKRARALITMRKSSFPPKFYSMLSSCADLATKLKSLIALSDREKELIIKITADMIKENYPIGEILSALEISYEHLLFYLCATSALEGSELKDYFIAYRKSKIANRFEIHNLEDRLKNNKFLWRFPTRQSILEKLKIPPQQQLWIDGFGIEWTDFTLNLLRKELDEKFDIHFSITRANLPSITEKNKWPERADVWRELDAEGHKYRRYPLSLVKQLDIMADMINKVKEKALYNDPLLITADHGLTRYEFCSNYTIEPPPGVSEIHKWGRCALLNKITPEVTKQRQPWVVEETKWLCLLQHSRFKGGTGATNEVHGGATPEEVLVPVILISRKDREKTIHCRLLTDKISLDFSGRGHIKVEVSPDPGTLKIRFPILGKSFSGEKKEKGIYSFILEGIKPSKYDIIITSGSKEIAKFNLTITGAMGLEEEDLGI